MFSNDDEGHRHEDTTVPGLGGTLTQSASPRRSTPTTTYI